MKKLFSEKNVQILSLILFVLSFIALAGSIQQYFQFQKSKDLDLSYIGSFSAWGALLTGVLSLISFVFLLVKKSSIIKSSISLLVSALAIWLIISTEDNYRSFWKPCWEIELLDISEKERVIIREGWKEGKISIDSLNSLKMKYKNEPGVKLFK